MDTNELLPHFDVTTDPNFNELLNRFGYVLSLMHIDHHSEPDSSEVRFLLRAALFLYGNLKKHGHLLERKLKDCKTIPKTELNSLLGKFHDGTLLSDVCQQLLMTVTGPNHILEIQDFCDNFLDANQYSMILTKVRESRRLQVPEDRTATEAKFIIITTFQLQSPAEIELAIQRIVDKVEFDVLAWIISFQETSTYFAIKCLVVQKELCSRLERGSVSSEFIGSMYEVSALDDDGLGMYFKCLQNRMFSSSLMTFFTNYLSAVEAPNKNVEQAKLMQHDFHHLSFLIAAAMSRKSSCRVEFHKKLAGTSVDGNVLLRIRQLNFLYEF